MNWKFCAIHCALPEGAVNPLSTKCYDPGTWIPACGFRLRRQKIYVVIYYQNDEFTMNIDSCYVTKDAYTQHDEC